MTPNFHKIDKKKFKGILWSFHFTPFEIIIQLWKLVTEIIYNSIKKVFQYFLLPDRIMKGGTFWISRNGGIIEKGG